MKERNVDRQREQRIDNGDWIDARLRAARPAPIADDGFAARVMAALPPVAALAPAWRKPVVGMLWAAAALGAAVSLPGAALDVVREGYRLFTAYPVSVPGLALVLGGGAALLWTVAGYALRDELATR
jgi:hypothetical protein